MGRGQRSDRPPIERASANDLLQRSVGDRPEQTHVGAVLLLDGALDAVALRAVLAPRIASVPRLRQRLLPTPLGCGRPIWVDDAAFDLAAHVTERPCPAPGDERALLDVAAAVVTTRLPAGRPLWRLAVVTGVHGGRSAVVLVFHHVLADGVGGLAVLAHLVDGAADRVSTDRVSTDRVSTGPVSTGPVSTGPGATDPGAADPPDFPRPAPTRWELAADAGRQRARALRRLPGQLRRVLAAARLLRGDGVRAPRTSLNRPTGTERRFAVARADLAAVRAAGHAHGGTVNDVLLAAVTGALHEHLRAGGERVDQVVVSVAVSAHPAEQEREVRNAVGVVPLLLPASGTPAERLAEVARRTPVLRTGDRAAAAVVLEQLFGVLARLRVIRWYVRRQRRVTTFATNLRGPDRPLALAGATVAGVLPLSAISGNVAAAFAALSYAGVLVVTVVGDPQVCADVEGLAGRVQHQLDELTATP
jgi:diacylglycerol O-acyltransferase / wax synthase